MQNDLIMNQLPLPKYYDGQNWNTVLKPTRKSIPKYLHQDLPELKHLYIKEIFKEMGKFNCPKLDFFNTIIKKRNANKDQSKLKNDIKKKQGRLTGRTGRSTQLSNPRIQKDNYISVKQQLQYALLLADRDSNIVDSLVQKAKEIQESSVSIRQKKRAANSGRVFRSSQKFKAKSQYQIPALPRNKPNRNFFDNTVDLVFRNRRNLFLQKMKKPRQVSNKSQAYQKKLNSLQLIQFKDSEN